MYDTLSNKYIISNNNYIKRQINKYHFKDNFLKFLQLNIILSYQNSIN